MPEFTNAQLIVILQKSARRINRKLCLTGTDNQIVIDTTTGDITPDNDEDLKDLVLLQAECLITQRSFTEFLSADSASAGVMVKDGEQTVDTRSGGSSRANLLGSDSPANPCAELAEGLNAEKLKRMMGPGGGGSLIY